MDDPQTKNFTFVTMADVVDVMASYPSDGKKLQKTRQIYTGGEGNSHIDFEVDHTPSSL
jgi:hypothetical protein